eukprot:TRINITY_DN1551_c0_g1_i1.p1 TRINITY_DN1551_c0_g1~~TRINITY_DN1551_c0_g1_i1.p1  ORF type:complete len:238 (+),score=47.38 TRINITY_DN1551_c0_g1_i1:87-716(+)
MQHFLTKSSTINYYNNAVTSYHNEAKQFYYSDTLCKSTIDNTISKYLQSNNNLAPSIIDVGCGSGITLLDLTQNFDLDHHKVMGVDPAVEMVQFCQRLMGDVRFEVGEAGALPVEDCSVDVLVCLFVIHHIEKDGLVGVFREWQRCVRQGGSVIVAHWIGDGCEDGCEYYSNEDIVGWLKEEGFTCLSVEEKMSEDMGIPYGVVEVMRD